MARSLTLGERQPLQVGATDAGYPYSFFNERGEADGFGTDILDAVARVMNLRIRRVARPGLELHAAFRRGEFDLLQLYSRTPERETFADFSVPVLTLEGAVFVRRDGPVRALPDLNGKPFAIVGSGSVGELFLRDSGVQAQVRQVASTTEAMRLVESGECAGTFMTQLTALMDIQRFDLRHVVMLGAPVEGYDVRHCIAVHQGDALLLARINEGLAILHENGEFDRLYRKWFGRVSGVSFTRTEVATYAAAALALGLVVALWTGRRQRALRRHIETLNAGLEAGISARTAELAARIQQVERLNADQQALVRDLRSSQQAADRSAARLQEANAQLLTANQELEAFSYSASHDLRAPLRNITGFLELLSLRTAGQLDAESGRFITVMTQETKRLGMLIDDLLAFSRTGRSALRLEAVPVADLVAEVQRDLATELAGREVEWRIGELPVVQGDRTLLRQVFANLLGNAVKFTRRRPQAVIEVGTAPAPDLLATVFVRDNGAGFNPKYADRIFGVFQRLHTAREFEGTGIGLAIVNRIVTRHGGRVWAEGKLDNGAVFYLTLKKLPPA